MEVNDYDNFICTTVKIKHPGTSGLYDTHFLVCLTWVKHIGFDSQHGDYSENFHFSTPNVYREHTFNIICSAGTDVSFDVQMIRNVLRSQCLRLGGLIQEASDDVIKSKEWTVFMSFNLFRTMWLINHFYVVDDIIKDYVI